MQLLQNTRNTVIKLFTKPTLHNTLYSVGFVLLAIGLPLSKWLTGMSVFWIVGVWLADPRWQLKWQLLKLNKYKLVASSTIFGITLLGVLYSAPTHYALHDLRHKLPLLLIPLVMAQTAAINYRMIKVVLHFFVLANLVAILICLANVVVSHIHEPRAISMFISHIRFSLFICFCVAVCIYYYFTTASYKMYYASGVVVFIAFLIFLQSLTGIVIIVMLVGVGALYLAVVHRQTKWLVAGTLLLIMLVSVLINKINTINAGFYYQPNSVLTMPNNTLYKHGYHTTSFGGMCENGASIDSCVNLDELKKYWLLRTHGDSLFAGKNRTTGKHYTVLRFLASKHLTKDARGVLALSNAEIASINRGVPNYLYQNKLNPLGRLYELLYEYNNYKMGFTPNGHSVVMRVYFARTAWQVFKQHKLIGVGTGNIEVATQQVYKALQVPLAEKNWFHAHNQFLTFLATFGVIGVLCIVLAWLFIAKQIGNNKLFSAFAVIILLSFLNEDTLETQAGVGFYGLMLNLFLFQYLPSTTTPKNTTSV